MTDSATPPLAVPGKQFGPIREALRGSWSIRWADDTVRHILDALDAAERLAVFEREQRDLRHAAWLEERDGREAAERRSAKAEAQATAMTHQAIYSETLLQAAERRVAEAERESSLLDDLLEQMSDVVQRALAQTREAISERDAAARENERLRKRLAFYADRGTWERVEEFNATGWMYSGDEDPWAMALGALAAEPREPEGEER